MRSRSDSSLRVTGLCAGRAERRTSVRARFCYARASLKILLPEGWLVHLVSFLPERHQLPRLTRVPNFKDGATLIRRRSSRPVPRRPIDLAAFVVAVVMVAILPLALHMLSSRDTSSGTVVGQPMNGVSMAVVTMSGITAYFPRVTCDSADPRNIRVELGHWPALDYQPIYFFLAGSVDGSSATSMVAAAQPGFTLDQVGVGSIWIDSVLAAALTHDRPSDQVDTGSLTFRGVDRSNAPFTGSVRCTA